MRSSPNVNSFLSSGKRKKKKVPGDVSVPFHARMFSLGFSVNASASWESGELAGSYEGPEQGNKGTSAEK
jgi:hypothetical protein